MIKKALLENLTNGYKNGEFFVLPSSVNGQKSMFGHIGIGSDVGIEMSKAAMIERYTRAIDSRITPIGSAGQGITRAINPDEFQSLLVIDNFFSPEKLIIPTIEPPKIKVATNSILVGTLDPTTMYAQTVIPKPVKKPCTKRHLYTEKDGVWVCSRCDRPMYS